MNLKQKYWVFSVGFVVLTLVFLAGMGVYVWQGLPQNVQAQLSQTPDDLIAPLFLGGSLLLIILLFFLNEMFHSYILPLDRLTEDSSLVTTVNPEHEIRVQGCREVMQLARRMNEAATQMRQMRDQLESGPVGDSALLQREEALLLEALNRMPQGVLLVNAWSQIVYFNARALDICAVLLEESGGHDSAIGYMGLGRSLEDLLGPEIAERIGEAGASVPAEGARLGAFRGFEADFLREKGICAGIVPLGSDKEGTGALMVYLERADGYGDGETAEHACRCASSLVCSLHDDIPLEILSPTRLDPRLLEEPVPTPPLDDVFLRELPCTIFDLETTGLDPHGGDEIVSVSAVRVVRGRICQGETFHQLIRPYGDISAASERVHGISAEMVREKPRPDQVLASFRFYCRDSVLVSHCAEFDMLFLRQQGHKVGLQFANPVLDTLLLAAAVLSSRKDQTLEATARRLGARIHGRHSSLGDALTAAEIYLKLVPMLEKQDIFTLRQAREASRRMERCVDYSRIPKLCNMQGG
ncbi:MAG: 3'-5' exonuclease [Desulfohalobiaceae bacterium]|nr:3'-5' exonuclease [Desulfohalobiaceae bacterium]